MAKDSEEDEREYLGVEILEAVEKQHKLIDMAAQSVLERISKVIDMLDTRLNDLQDLKLILKGIDENIHRLNQNQIKMAKEIGLDAEE